MSAGCGNGWNFSRKTRITGCRSATIRWKDPQSCLKSYASTAWAEMPPSRTRRLISNVRIKQEGGGDIEAHSNFIVYRTRMEKDEDFFVGTRKDILRRVNGDFKIAQRTIILDQAILGAKNIS